VAAGAPGADESVGRFAGPAGEVAAATGSLPADPEAAGLAGASGPFADAGALAGVVAGWTDLAGAGAAG
jgi:hypothetical protein